MYNGDWGHVGKLDYLRTQFKALGLNFMGIQEARTPESCSRSQDVYRPAGGADQGRGGIELWINLTQAYAYTDTGPAFFGSPPLCRRSQRSSVPAGPWRH